MDKSPIMELVKIYRIFNATDKNSDDGLDKQEWMQMVYIMHRLVAIEADQDPDYDYHTDSGWHNIGSTKGVFYVWLMRMQGYMDNGYKRSEKLARFRELMDTGGDIESEFAGMISNEYELPKPNSAANKMLRRMLFIHRIDVAAWEEKKKAIATIITS